MENDSITITAAMTFEDYNAFQERFLKKTRLQWSLIVLLATVILMYMRWRDAGIIIIGAIMVVYGVLPMLLKKVWEKRNGNYLSLEKQVFIITAQGIERRLETETRTAQWSDLYAVEETDHSFLIYITKSQCYCLTKHSIENDGQWTLLQQYFQNIPPYKERPWRWLAIVFFAVCSLPVLFLIWMMLESIL
jgi:hypothetical protein